MSDELIFETRDEWRYAPSVNINLDVGVDEDLARDLQKIPEKLSFKIGEVADIVGVKPYVLRYWETEFSTLKPQKSKHNQRMYTHKDVEMILMIKKLLYKDRFSIEGARSVIKDLKRETKKVTTITSAVNHYEDLRDKVHDLIADIQKLKEMFK